MNQEFYDNLKMGSIKGWHEYGILPSLTGAQALLESDDGNSELAAVYNNYFGIKADERWDGEKILLPTKEVIDGEVIDTEAYFRVYENPEDSVVDHGKFLVENERYNALIGERDYKIAAAKISEAGYATDPDYANKLIEIIEQEEFYNWDREAFNGTEDPNPGSPEPIDLVIKEQLIEPIPNYNCYSEENSKKGITIHQTANYNAGAGAQAHADIQTKGDMITEDSAASWHWQVDDKEAIRSYAHEVACYHAASQEGNITTIGIEGCVNSDADYSKAIENLAQLTRYIMVMENIAIENVVQHNSWSGKDCPMEIRKSREGISWDDFIEMVKNIDGGDTKPSDPPEDPIKDYEGIVDSYVEEGTFTFSKDVDLKKEPNVSSETVGIININDTISYEKIFIGNGFVWLQYLDLLGNKVYVPCRTYENGVYGPLWGILDKKPEDSLKSYPENGIFTPNEAIIVRDYPSTSANRIVTYYSGESVIYHTVILGNGYVWLQYTSFSNKERYIPCRTYENGEYGELWGTIV